MQTFIMMVGLPGSGKSYKAKQLAEEFFAQVFSSDDYREKITGDASDQSKNDEVFKQLYADMTQALRLNVNCIFDATNVTLKSRRKVLNQIASMSDIKKVAYVMPTPVEMCYERDMKRERTVGKAVIDKFLYSFQYPQYFEGFDAILIDSWSPIDTITDKLQADILESTMLTFNQNNPHHAYTLGEHCWRLSNHYPKERERVEYYAAQYHDVGKLFTQTTDDNGISHYYHHENVGAYYLISHPHVMRIQMMDDKAFTKMMFYINYHMLGHNITRERTAEKYRKIFGEELYSSLMQFAEFDKYASGTYKK